MYQGLAYDFADVVPEVLQSGIVNSRCSFQSPVNALTADGSPSNTGGDSGDGWNNVAGYQAIQCLDAPTSNSNITAKERKSETEVESGNSEHVWLAGFYPEIAKHTEWRAVLTDAGGDTIIYDVLGAESDSQAKTTRVLVQVATV